MLTYTTPTITAPRWMFDMAQQRHILIGGTTGSGKSVALNGFLRSLMRFTPDEVQLILVDPKGVELQEWEDVPHTIGHFCDLEEINSLFDHLRQVMEQRFVEMRRARVKQYDGPEVWIVIDEYADLKLASKLFGPQYKKLIPNIIAIACKGRAAGLHLVICTQRPTQDIIDGAIHANLDTVLALRTVTRKDSQNLIYEGGCEKLPIHGEALYLTPSHAGITKVSIPLYDDIPEIIEFWARQR